MENALSRDRNIVGALWEIIFTLLRKLLSSQVKISRTNSNKITIINLIR